MSMTQPFNTPLFMPMTHAARLANRRESAASAHTAAAKEEPPQVRDKLGESLTHLFSLKPALQPPTPVPVPEPVDESLAQRALKFLFSEEPPARPSAAAEPPPSKDRDWGPGKLLQAIQREAEQAGQAILRATDGLRQGGASKGGGSSGAPGAPGAPAATQSVAQLLEAHAAAVAQLHAALVEDPLFRPKQHDGLWLLRFVLSHQANLPKAVAAARFTLRWRAEHRLDQIGELVRARPLCEWPSAGKIGRVFPVHLCQPDPRRGPLVVLRAAEFDPDRLARAGISKRDDFEYALHQTEWLHLAADAVTRKTGVLTKVCRLLDLRGASGKNMQACFFGPVGAAASSQPIEDAYPQLVGALLVFNLPRGGLRWMWDNTVKPLLPERMRVKTFVVDQESDADRRLVAEYIALEHLHTTFGGSSGAWPPPSAAGTIKGKGRR